MNLFTFVSAAVLVLAAGDALAQNQTIADGQTIRGRIDRNERLPGGEKAGDCYRFALDAPAEVTVVQRSRAFDSYVYVFEDEACEGFQRHEDDDGDGDGGRNARLTRWMPAGAYSIGASAYEADSRGDYTLALMVEPDLAAPPPPQEAAGPSELDAALDTMAAWFQAQDEPAEATSSPAPVSLPSLSAILAAREAEVAATPLPAPAPAIQSGPERPYLRLDDAMIAFVAEGSPQRSGAPFICWNLPGDGRLEMRLAADFPGRVELFEGTDCPGAPIFTGRMSEGDIGYVVRADTRSDRPRSVALVAAVGQTGVATMSASRSSDAGGAVRGFPLSPVERVGSLASPLAPAPVVEAEQYTSDDATCRAAYDALAKYDGDGSSPYRMRLSVVSAAEYRRRHGLVPAPAGDEAIQEMIRHADFFGGLATAVMTEEGATTAVASLLVAAQCDRRFGFTPVTEVPR